MNVIPQGFPLFAVHADDPAVYAVIGWHPTANDMPQASVPIVVALSKTGVVAIIPQDGVRWTFHATQAEAETAASPQRYMMSEDNLRERMARLAEHLDKRERFAGSSLAASYIREELAK